MKRQAAHDDADDFCLSRSESGTAAEFASSDHTRRSAVSKLAKVGAGAVAFLTLGKVSTEDASARCEPCYQGGRGHCYLTSGCDGQYITYRYYSCGEYGYCSGTFCGSRRVAC